MAAISSIVLGIGAALSVVGTVAGVVGQQQSAKAQSRAEELRKKQMDLENMRRQRELVRQGVLARSQALAAATAQGAAEGSGLQGGYGNIGSAIGRQSLAQNQNYQIGNQTFDANAAAARGQSLSNLGAGIQSFGNSILSNYGTFERIGQVGVVK